MSTTMQHFSRLCIAVGVSALLFWSCERVVDGLEAPANSNNPEVFIDGFSAGLNYAAFGGSVPSAFAVDTEVTFGKSKMSMRFAVPDVGDPRGAYAGGTFFTSSGRDLSEYDALTFWGRASQPASIDVLGFGNDLGVNRYQVTMNAVRMNTNWQKYIIPLPDAARLINERGMFFYSEGAENGNGYTFWIDEVKFEKLGTVAHQSASILGGVDVDNPAELGETFRINNLVSTHNLPSGINQSVGVTPAYMTFASSDETVATVDATGLVTVVGTGIASITAKLGSLDAEGSMIINSTGLANRPTTAPPTPTQLAANVISLYTNAYTDVNVDTWNTRWEFSTADESFINVAGQDVIRYRNLNFVGIEFTSNRINATTMTHFRMDIWTPDPTVLPAEFKILLVDFGANGQFGGGDDSSHEVTVRAPTLQSEQWVSLDIPLSQFTGLASRANLAQLVLSGSLPNVYVTNVYFYRSVVVPTSPSTPAATPSFAAADVISVFSPVYTNIPGTNLNPGWGQATQVTFVNILGRNTMRYGGLNYQGIELGSAQNVTSMGFLHIDYWTANSTALSVFLISPGPVEHSVALTVPTTGWNTASIPLANFGAVNRANVFQLKFEGNGDIFIGNIFFRR
jgi:hypothetical protein